ncbi:MAG: hypothetical protein ACI9FZ_000799 [Bacteroidia bacterium]|jgi:hypothetical protein
MATLLRLTLCCDPLLSDALFGFRLNRSRREIFITAGTGSRGHVVMFIIDVWRIDLDEKNEWAVQCLEIDLNRAFYQRCTQPRSEDLRTSPSPNRGVSACGGP